MPRSKHEPDLRVRGPSKRPGREEPATAARPLAQGDRREGENGRERTWTGLDRPGEISPADVQLGAHTPAGEQAERMRIEDARRGATSNPSVPVLGEEAAAAQRRERAAAKRAAVRRSR